MTISALFSLKSAVCDVVNVMINDRWVGRDPAFGAGGYRLGP
jgi:hypothetical protein